MAEHDYELSDGSRQVLIECFKQYDKSNDGVLCVEELEEALLFAGIISTPDGITAMTAHFDINKDGKLQITDLVDNWKALAQYSVNGAELLAAFKTIDTDGNNYIEADELKIVLTKKGERWKQNEAEKCIEMLKRFDKDGDGKFNYFEFVEMFTDNMYPFKKPKDVPRQDITQEYEQVKASEGTEEQIS